ncbi:MAG: hypothetical protein V1725_00145 [archaeon]
MMNTTSLFLLSLAFLLLTSCTANTQSSITGEPPVGGVYADGFNGTNREISDTPDQNPEMRRGKVTDAERRQQMADMQQQAKSACEGKTEEDACVLGRGEGICMLENGQLLCTPNWQNGPQGEPPERPS